MRIPTYRGLACLLTPLTTGGLFMAAQPDKPRITPAIKVITNLTEAEWEYACRAGTTTAFHFGDSLSSEQANFTCTAPCGSASKASYLRKIAKVGSYKPNAFGLYDMHGNVWEWCADWYDKDYYRNSPRADPKGPAAGVLSTGYKDFYRVEGGCWLGEGRACRAAYRFRAMPHDNYRLIGFRVVCEREKTP